MGSTNNKVIVDKSVDILTTLYQRLLQKHGLKASIDFSGLSEQIMNALNSGSTAQIQSVINSFIDDKIRTFDLKAGEKALKSAQSHRHRAVMNDLIGFSKTYNKACAEAISNNVTLENTNSQDNKQQPSFKESIANFSSSQPPPEQSVSMEEALRRNAQALYERTGKVPNGYTLQNGQVIKDKSAENTSKPEQKLQESSLDEEGPNR